MLLPTILVMLVRGRMKITLHSSTTILQRRLLTTGGIKEGHEETRQDNLYNILFTLEILFLVVLQLRRREKEIHQITWYIPISWHNPDAKYVGQKLHMFAAVVVITFVMKICPFLSR